MGIVFRQSIKTTIVTFTGTLLGALTIYLYTVVLSQQVNGFVRNMFNYAGLLQMFAVVGTTGTVSTFILKYPEGQKRNTVFTMCLFVPLAAVLITIVPYIFYQPRILRLYHPIDRPLVATYYMLMPLLVLLWSYMALFENFLIGQHKTAVSTFMREIALRIINLAIICLFYFKAISFTTFLVGSVLIYGIPPLLMIAIALRIPHFRFSLRQGELGRKDYRALIHFSWYHLLMSVSVVAMAYIDSNILGVLSPMGLAAVAIYTTAVFIASVAIVPYRAMSAAVSPTFNRTYLDKDMPQLQNAFNRAAINALLISVLMVIIIGTNLHNAVAILRPEYKMVGPIVLIIMIGRLAEAGSGFNTEVINVSEYYKYNFRISIVLLFMVILFCFLLIPRFDIYGAAWATTISLILFNVAKALFAYKKLDLQPFSFKTLLILFSGAIAALAGYFLPHITNPFVDAMVRTFVILIVYGAMLLWLKPSEDLTTYLRSIRENKRLF